MDLKIVLLTALLGISFASLRADFDGFLFKFGEHYDKQEVRVRYKLYKESRDEVDNHNSNPDKKWDMAINQFSAMTSEERNQYLGLRNESESLDTDARQFEPENLLGNPASVDNVALGFVTRPKDQRSCGSCWAFGAIAAFEGAYARATNVLKSFSEKELLDCTYSNRDGCQGGWYQDAWGYIQRHRRIAALKDAPYDYAQDRGCDYGGEFQGRVPNGMRNARYERYYTVARSDSELESAVARAVVAVAMIVEDDFFSYGSGIYGGCSTWKNVGHAVTMVGYDKDSWKVKNSWGRYWGEGGYVRFSRSKDNNCRLAEYAKFPVVTFVDRKQTDEADPKTARTRLPNHGCAWGDEYPCSDMNCNYGCKSGTCWAQCNGVCVISGATDRCAGCKEWCYVEATCSKHEDCFAHRYKTCNSACSL